MFTEDQLLKLLKVQSNLSHKDFEMLFGDRGEYLFRLFARENWNLVSFLFNKVNGEDRQKLLNHVNLLIQ